MRRPGPRRPEDGSLRNSGTNCGRYHGRPAKIWFCSSIFCLSICQPKRVFLLLRRSAPPLLHPTTPLSPLLLLLRLTPPRTRNKRWWRKSVLVRWWCYTPGSLLFPLFATVGVEGKSAGRSPRPRTVGTRRVAIWTHLGLPINFVALRCVSSTDSSASLAIS